MANYGNRIARVDVIIGGVDQAKSKLKELEQVSSNLGEEIKKAKKELEATAKTTQYETYKKIYDEALDRQKEITKVISDLMQKIKEAEGTAAKDVYEAQYNQLIIAKDELRRTMDNAKAVMEANHTSYDAAKKNLTEKEKEKKLVDKQIREMRANISTIEEVLGNLSGSTLKQLSDALKDINKNLKYADPKDVERIAGIRENIKQIADEIQRRKGNLVEFSDIMGNIGTVSDKSLSMAKQRLQELVTSTKQNTQEIQTYREQLKKVEDEEQRRLAQRAQTTLGQVRGGTFDGTIGETREAIKLLEQYKQQLKTSDTQGIKQVDDAIKSLNEQVKNASDNTMSLQYALELSRKISEGTFDGTIEDLQKLKKTLEEYKAELNLLEKVEIKLPNMKEATLMDRGAIEKNIASLEKEIEKNNTEEAKKELKIYKEALDKLGDSVPKLKEINDALSKISKKEREVAQSAVDINDVMLHLKTAPLEKLQQAAAQLQQELTEAERGTRTYIETSAKLRQVNSQIKDVKDSWEEHDNQIVATIKRLTSYVLVYAGFNEVWGRIKQLYQANLELSDSMADIQKTTGLSAESIAELSKEIDGIDTRTAQQELHDLAYEAGKLGISAKEDVLGFVKAGNQLLVALGEDLGGAEAVRQLMKVNAILGETAKLGVEKALLATGSAINEISQTSRASAGPIVDIVTRIGAIGNAAGMSMSDLIALSGTVDALGQQAEMSGTALNTFISTLTSNTTEVAQAVGLSDDYLKNLINQGRTMEAIIAVFEKMKAMGGLDVLAPIMKDLGSDGERIKQVLVTLSSGVDELKAQVFTSSRAFQEATSVTDEYNIKNESAMAIVLRMGNAIRESFINSGLVEWLTDVLRWVASIPNQFKRGESGIRALAVAIQLLIGVLFATSKAVQTASLNMLLFFKRVKAGSVSLNIFSKALKGVWTAIKMNPLGWLTLAVTALSSAWTYFSKSVSESGKAMAEFESTLQKERFELDNLRFAIDKANKANGERAALIKQLNDKYGAYLGFMVTENNYAEKQEYIYSLINARLRETLALKMRDKMMENIVDKYSDQLQELNAQAISSLNEMARVGETNAGDAMVRIINGIKKAAKEGLLPGDALKDFMDKYDYELNEIVYGKNRGLFTAVQGLLEIEKKIQEESKSTQTFLEGNAKAAKETVDQLMRMDLRKSNVGILSSKDGNELTTYLQQATTYVQRLRNEVEELNAKRDKGEKLSQQEEADLEEKNRQLGVYTYNIEQVQKRIKALGMESVWGQGLSLETAGVDKLVATYKKLEAMMKSINEDKDYAATFASRGFKSAKEEYDALKKMEDDVAKVLKEKWGRDTNGNWLKERSGGSRGEDKRMREEIDSAMSALEAYFLRRQQAIRQAYLDEQITTEEMNRQIDSTEEEHLLARVELRKRLLGKDSTFNKDLYGMSDKDLDKLSGYLNKLGDRETDGMAKDLEKDLLQVQEMAIKYRMNIEQELRKYNPFESLVFEFEESLDKLKLLNPEMEKLSREMLGMSGTLSQDEIDRRMDALAELSRESYNLTETELRGRLQSIDKLWGESMSSEQMSLMLKKLRDFYQDSKAAAEKYAKDIKDMIDVQWKMSGNEEMWENREKSADQDTDLIRTAGELGLASSQSSILGSSQVDKAELEILRIKLETAQQYYEQFYARRDELIQQAIASGATEQEAQESYRMAEKEAMYALATAYEEQSKKELEITKEKLESLKNYTDAIVDFSGQMGEAAFGEVEDRKAAAKQLLQTTMKLTKDLIMQKVQELVMKKVLGTQEVAQEAATQNSITSLKGAQTIASLTAEGAETAAQVPLGIAKGAAVTVGKLGWWGIPLIAVISAALSALMGVAMGKLNKAKEEVASATGASSNKGRVAAGMLTYAKGDYPILGNDGRIYNARYQKELKTGVYRGGAHFGIFSEKKPEMIVDGDTTQKLILNYPHIYDSILTIARHGQLKQAAMPTYAVGSYPVPQPTVSVQGADMAGAEANVQMQQTLMQLSATVAALTERLNKPISATMDPYQANKTLKKTDKFMTKRGLV